MFQSIGFKYYKHSHTPLFKGLASLFFGCPFIHPSILLRKSVLESHNISYDTDIRYAQDYALNTRLWQLGEMVNLGESLLRYRVHKSPQRITSDDNKEAIVLGRMLGWHRILKVFQCDCPYHLLIMHDKFGNYSDTITKDELVFIIPYFNFLLKMVNANKTLGIVDHDSFLYYISNQVNRILQFPRLKISSFFRCYYEALKLGLSISHWQVCQHSFKGRLKEFIAI